MGVPDWGPRLEREKRWVSPIEGKEMMGVPDWVYGCPGLGLWVSRIGFLGFMGVPDWVIFQFMADHEFNNPAT